MVVRRSSSVCLSAHEHCDLFLFTGRRSAPVLLDLDPLMDMLWPYGPHWRNELSERRRVANLDCDIYYGHVSSTPYRIHERINEITVQIKVHECIEEHDVCAREHILLNALPSSLRQTTLTQSRGTIGSRGWTQYELIILDYC